jgi:flagellar motility protein MotE (MotC chaperone)
MDKTVEGREESKTNPIQWFLLVVLIPVLFAVTVALIVSTVAGVNVFEAAKEFGEKVPVLSNILSKDSEDDIVQLEKDRIELEGQIKDREAKIDQLHSKLENQDKEMERAQLEKERLLQEIDELNAIQEDSKRAFKDIVRTYETLSAKKAAPIISQMSEVEALRILTTIKPEALASLLEEMEPAKAAQFTELLTNESHTGD